MAPFLSESLAFRRIRVYYMKYRKSLDRRRINDMSSGLSGVLPLSGHDVKKGVVEMTGTRIALGEGTEPGRTAAVGGGFPR